MHAVNFFPNCSMQTVDNNIIKQRLNLSNEGVICTYRYYAYSNTGTFDNLNPILLIKVLFLQRLPTK